MKNKVNNLIMPPGEGWVKLFFLAKTKKAAEDSGFFELVTKTVTKAQKAKNL